MPPLLKFGKVTKIPYSDGFDRKEMNVLRDGFGPESEQDKWVGVFNRKTLYLHRAHSGKGIYQLRFKINKNGTGEIKWAKASKDIIIISKHYEAAILDFIVAHVILGHDIDFPLHDKVEENKAGSFQLNIAGTQQPEQRVTTRMLKGQFK